MQKQCAMATSTSAREPSGAAYPCNPECQVDPLGQVARRTKLTRWVRESGD